MNKMKILSLIGVGALVLILLPLYNWFTWLPLWAERVFNSLVCAGTLWMAWRHYRQKSVGIWNLALVMIAIYFNPIFIIKFESTYINAFIDLICILFLAFFAFRKEYPEEKESSEKDNRE